MSGQRGLTQQQRTFAHLVARGMEYAPAALQAGFAASNARQAGFRLMRNEKVLALVAELSQDRIIRNGITQEKLAVGLFELAFSDMSEVAGIDSLEALKALPANVRRAVRTFKIRRSFRPGRRDEEGAEVEELTISMHDKLPAFAQLAKLLGLNAETEQPRVNLTLIAQYAAQFGMDPEELVTEAQTLMKAIERPGKGNE